MTITSARSITSLVKPPRSVFLNYPIGHQAGKPFDHDGQIAIVGAALRLLESAGDAGTIEDLPYEWGGDWESAAQARGL